MKLLDFVVRESIIVDLQATGKEQAIREMVGSLHRAGRLANDVESVIKAFWGAKSSARRVSGRAWRSRTRGIRRFSAWSGPSRCRTAVSTSMRWTASRLIFSFFWSRPRTSPATTFGHWRIFHDT